MCAKLCFMNKFCHKQLRETGSWSIYLTEVNGFSTSTRKRLIFNALNKWSVYFLQRGFIFLTSERLSDVKLKGCYNFTY